MARAITQNLAWAVAFVISALVFGGILGLFILSNPAKTPLESSHGHEHVSESSHSKDGEHGSQQTSHSDKGEGEEEEISAHDYKADPAEAPASPEAPHQQEQ